MIRLLVLFVMSISLGACVSNRYNPAPDRPQRSTPPATSSSPASAKTAPYVVFGQRYFPITDATDYRKRGVASWYGGKFHGRQTANGELYDMHQYTAAHTTLPLPTLVKVTNLRNGASVIVRVNDRGPFVKNRLIDLSYAAALEIGMIDDGTTLVEVEAIMTADAVPSAPVRPKPVIAQASTASTRTASTSTASTRTLDTTPDPALISTTPRRTDDVYVAPQAKTGISVDPPATQPDDGAATIFVQVGAFGEYTNAVRMQSSLYNAGIGDVRLNSGDRQGIPVHRVQIGPIAGVDEYDILIAQLDSIGISDTHLVTE